MKSLVKKSDKLTNPCSSTLPLSKQSKKAKTALKSLSLSPKTNGSQTPLSLKSSNSMLLKSREALATQLTGKKEKTSQSKTSRRKVKTKKKPSKKKSNHSSTSSRKSILLKTMKKIRKNQNKPKLKKKTKMKSPSSKDNTKLLTNFTKT